LIDRKFKTLKIYCKESKKSCKYEDEFSGLMILVNITPLSKTLFRQILVAAPAGGGFYPTVGVDEQFTTKNDQSARQDSNLRQRDYKIISESERSFSRLRD
jgi:hypothetical protein